MSRVERRIGKYELQERLGSGGITEVWKAFDTGLQRKVAIKLLHADLQSDPGFVKRFEREARIVASLHHPNIVQVHEFEIAQPPVSESTIAYLVMDYVEGPTLADYIARTSRAGKFPSAAEIIHLFMSIGAAVDYAHKKGIVHRNLTPANILLDQSKTARNPMGEPILVDFGVAKLLGVSTGTLSGILVGSPQCISPEQAQGQPGTERSDIYALGVILYEICTGILPFRGENPTEIMQQHMRSLPTPPNLINPYISPALAEVILRCLAKDPTARFPSATSITAALARVFNMPVPGNAMTPTYNINLANSPGHPTPVSPGMISFAEGPPPQVAVVPAPSPTSSIEERDQVSPAAYLKTPPGSLSPSRPVPSSPPLTPVPPKRRNRLLLVLASLLLFALVGSGVLVFLLSHGGSVTANQLAGSVFFVNSGQLNEDSNQGLNDELQIDLNNVPAPDPGKSYYAWLLGDTVLNANQNSSPNKQTAPILLGSLHVNDGNISFHYINPQHINLLAVTSQLLITEEDSHRTPALPSSDRSTWRYYGEVPQLRPHTIAESELGALRHLLCDGPDLLPKGIRGGTAIQLLLHTQSILEWASSARDAWNGTQTADTGFINRQVVRILDYLDGASVVVQDVPPRTPPLADAKGMLNGIIITQKGKPKSYIDRISGTMQDVIVAPGV
ncbi:MAG TPA: serine/threonine-protein kinase, partial [Ktedonobacteraceae bacterium]